MRISAFPLQLSIVGEFGAVSHHKQATTCVVWLGQTDSYTSVNACSLTSLIGYDTLGDSNRGEILISKFYRVCSMRVMMRVFLFACFLAQIH